MSSSLMSGAPPAIPPKIPGTNSSILALATMGLSSNKYVLGIMILLINLGARYIGNELNEFSHKILNHKFARRFLIFLVIWMGSRDLLVAFIITVGFIFISNTLLNEQSNYCILPVETLTNMNITKEEYAVAKQLIEKYEKTNPITLNTPNTPPNTPSTSQTNNTTKTVNNNEITK